MEVTTMSELITSLVFHIDCLVAMGAFIFYIYKTWTAENKEQMAQVQARCKEREDKLYNEISKNREVIASAITTIAHYAEKLDIIQKDISDIKTDITVIRSKD